MKKLLVSLTVLLGAASAFAQSDTGITVSTDQSRAAAVLSHAQELQARPVDKAVIAPGSSAGTHKHQPAHHHDKRHAKKKS